MTEDMMMVMVVYNEAVDMEVMEALEKSGLKNYTKTSGAYGRGSSSGTHLGNDIWPGLNNVLYVACSQKEAQRLMSEVRQLRPSLRREGVKAFAWRLEDAT